MAQITMYPAFVNSVETTITNSISDTDTIIYVLTDTAIPNAPNLLVLGTGASAETVLMTDKTGNMLTVTRGVQGSAKAWPNGTVIARNYTAYDHDTFKANIEDNATQLAQKANKTELLNYEEGVFTPVLKGATVAGNHLYDSVEGTYVVIGDMVFANFVISLSTKDSNMSGAVLIGGLPFPANFSVSSVLFSRVAFLDYPNDAKELKTASLANDIVLRFVIDGGDTLNVDSSLIKNNTNLFGTFVYKR